MTKEKTKIKGSRNAGRRIVLMPTRKRSAGRATEEAACAALRLRARSPAGVPLRFSPTGLSSRGLSFGPGFPKAARKLRRAARVAFGSSDAPRTPVLVPAGMMPEPPGRGPYPSARGRRTRSAVREYPPGRLLLGARFGDDITEMETKVNGKGTLLSRRLYGQNENGGITNAWGSAWSVRWPY